MEGPDCVQIDIFYYQAFLSPPGRCDGLLQQQFNKEADNKNVCQPSAWQMSGRGRKGSFLPICVTHQNQECICGSDKEAQE